MPTRELRRKPASFPITIPADASSASPRDLSPLVSGSTLIVTVPFSPTTDQDVSDEALYSQDGSIDCATRDVEQLGYLGHTSLTTDQDVSDEALYSQGGSIDSATRDIEQIGYLGHTSPTTDQPVHDH